MPLNLREARSFLAISQRRKHMKYGNVLLGQVEAVWNKLGGEEGVKKFLRGQLTVVARDIDFTVESFKVLVDETQSAEEAFEAGKFDWKNDELAGITSKNFPKPKNGKKIEKEIHILKFNQGMLKEMVLYEMNKAGYKPATLWDLSGLALKFPDSYRKFPIMALSSVVHEGGKYCVCLGGRRGVEFGMDTTSCGNNEWLDICVRYACVRK